MYIHIYQLRFIILIFMNKNKVYFKDFLNQKFIDEINRL
jgi:hypothetical protein